MTAERYTERWMPGSGPASAGGAPAICAVCRSRLPYMRTTVSSKPLPGLETWADRVVLLAACRYEGPVPAAVARLKFSGGVDCIPAFGALMCEALDRAGQSGAIDAVLGIPLHAARLRTRGFDQGKELAAAVSGRLTIPDRSSMLKRVRETSRQSELSDPADRLANVARAFEVCGSLNGEHLLLVDDVLTSGATVASAAGVLLTAGAGAVTVLTAAAAGPSDPS